MTGHFTVALVARAIDEQVARGFEEALDRGIANLEFSFDPNRLATERVREQRARVRLVKFSASSILRPEELLRMTREEFVECVLGRMLRDFAVHEVEEFFRYQGRRVFDPHPEVPGYRDQ